MNELWTNLCAAGGIVLDEATSAKLSRYLDLLTAANERMNLTRIVDRAAAEVGHVGDSLTLLPHLPKGAFAMGDIGSGGGMPGLVLAIVRPDAWVTLIESTRKKAAFLEATAKELGLANVTVSPLRAEEAGRGSLRGTLNVVTARAVGELAWLIEWAMPLLKSKGRLLAQKGARAAGEIASSGTALRLLRCGEPVVHPVVLPGADQHVIVEVVKEGTTGEKYPRVATTTGGRAL